MEKYKKLLEKIVKYRLFSSWDFVKITDYIFTNEEITVFYEYYLYNNSNETATETITIYNSELNAYIYENIN